MLRSFIRKKRALCATVAVTALLLLFCTIMMQNDLRRHIPDSLTNFVCPLPISHLPKIMLDLHGIIVQLQRTPNLNEQWSKDIEDQLVGILQQLDRKYEPPPRADDTHQLTVRTSVGDAREFCPKQFIHSKLAEPFYLSGSWLPVQPCPNVIPIETLVSVIIFWNETRANCATRLEHTLAAIERSHPSMHVFVAFDPSVCSWENSGEILTIKVVKVDKTWTPGQVWNSLSSQVKTPYTLVGRDLEDFSWLTNVRRQVSILSSDPLVHVVSGSVRNSTGHWQVGCYQSFLYNYILEYRDGYFLSKNECMFCDHVLGPFIARSETLMATVFNEGLSSFVIFEDWFLRLKSASKLVMNCPDALYFATDAAISDKQRTRKSWLSLAEKWQINRLILPESIKMSFSCKETGLKCTEMYSFTGKQMMPICCMDQLASAMQEFHEFSIKHNLLYNYIGGSVLGAVKFRGIIPWDFDGDAEFYFSNLSLILQWGEEQKKKNRGVYIADLNEKGPGYFRLRTPEMFVEMWARNDTAADKVMPDVFRRTPTKMRVHGIWVYGPPSPGLYARNMYGKEVLRHSSSWYHMGKKEWTAPYDVKRHFVPCEHYGHHACASRFQTDGSFQFTVP